MRKRQNRGAVEAGPGYTGYTAYITNRENRFVRSMSLHVSGSVQTHELTEF